MFGARNFQVLLADAPHRYPTERRAGFERRLTWTVAVSCVHAFLRTVFLLGTFPDSVLAHMM